MSMNEYDAKTPLVYKNMVGYLHTLDLITLIRPNYDETSIAVSQMSTNPEKIYEIVKSLKENVDIPVTIKIRAGWDHFSINCDEVARLATKAGVDAITIHGRTRSQLYTGFSNIDYIKMVRENSDKVVIGNGDMACHTHLPRQNTVAAHLGGTCYAHLRAHESAFANLHIVRHLHEVI